MYKLSFRFELYSNQKAWVEKYLFVNHRKLFTMGSNYIANEDDDDEPH